ncbi:hemerythrin domain-containing protein [Achromobacter sp. GG226]|nr:hemerythrin domain-containing protein [Verticiella sp. GG226]
MEVVTYLTKQHREVEGMLNKAVDCKNDPQKRLELFKEAADHLALHLESEEQVLFPAVKAAKTKDILMESLEEHLSLKRLMVDLMALDPKDETFEPKLKVLAEQAEHHHGEEEEDLFPKLKKGVPQDERERLAAEMDALQKRMDKQKAQPRNIVKGETDAAATI